MIIMVNSAQLPVKLYKFVCHERSLVQNIINKKNDFYILTFFSGSETSITQSFASKQGKPH